MRVPAILGRGKRPRLQFFSEVVAELKKVVWPSRQETIRLTLMVIAVSAAVGVFLGVVDYIFFNLFGPILGR